MSNLKKIDAFPNAPGLSEKLGLMESDVLPDEFVGHFLWKKRWYSICSMHYPPSEDCDLCKTGSYHNVFKRSIGSMIYKRMPGVWRWWVNR